MADEFVEDLLNTVKRVVKCGVCGKKHRLSSRGYRHCIHRMSKALYYSNSTTPCHADNTISHSFSTTEHNGLLHLAVAVGVPPAPRDRLLVLRKRIKAKPAWLTSLTTEQTDLLKFVTDEKWSFEARYDPRILAKATTATVGGWEPTIKAICEMTQADPRTKTINRMRSRYKREIRPGGSLHVEPREEITPNFEEVESFKELVKAAAPLMSWLSDGDTYRIRGGKIVATLCNKGRLSGVLVNKSADGTYIAVRKKSIRLLAAAEVSAFAEKNGWTFVGASTWTL